MGKIRVSTVYYNPNYGDCYTVYFNVTEKVVGGAVYFTCLSMSEHPDSPTGICEHSCGQLGKHNGVPIPFSALPAIHQKIVTNELNSLNRKD